MVACSTLVRVVAYVAVYLSYIKLLRGAEVACWAHNPKVLGSKPSGARAT